jgi:hypothetical protein
MAILSFVFKQLFTLLVPELFVWFEVVVRVRLPREPNFVQRCLSILSRCVIVVTFPLRANPNPQSPVLLVPDWHRAMAIDSFELDQLFTIHIPFAFTPSTC